MIYFKGLLPKNWQFLLCLKRSVAATETDSRYDWQACHTDLGATPV